MIGQDEAVDTLASALMRARCGLKDEDRPVASLLFVGPTGGWAEPAGGMRGGSKIAVSGSACTSCTFE